MIDSINENWKIPIGYFLASNLNSSQKAEVIRHTLILLKETDVYNQLNFRWMIK